MNVPGLVVGGLAIYVFALQAANKFAGAIGYSLGKIKWRLLPPGGKIRIELKNNNNVGVSITRIFGSVVYQNTVIAQFDTTESINLVPGQTVLAEIDFQVHTTGIFTSIAAAITSGYANLLKATITGKMKVPGFPDISFSKEVGFEAL